MTLVLIASDYRAANLRLQPWRFLSEIANGLRLLGHLVTVISDVEAKFAPAGTVSVRSVRLPASGNPELEGHIQALEPDVCLWNFGLTSAWHFAPERLAWPSIALFTSPVYGPQDLLRLGMARLWLARDHVLIHIVGAAVAHSRLRSALRPFRSVIVQSEATLRALASRGVASEQLHLIRPGVDDEFRIPLPEPATDEGPFVLGYMGSPLPIRGVLDLVDAVALVRAKGFDVRLSVLSRNSGQYARHERRLERRIAKLGLREVVTVRSGFMARDELIDELTRVDLLALPFQLVPSDAPLAVLEGMALGRPILSTRVASITEYLTDGCGYLADPGSPQTLAKAVAQAASDPMKRQCVRERALAHASGFATWPDVAAQVAQIVNTHSEVPS